MKKKLKELKWKIDSLTVFSHIKNDDVIRRLHALLDAVDKYVPDQETDHAISLYSDFVSALYENTADLTDYIHTLLLQDDNFYVKETAAGRSVPETIRHLQTSGKFSITKDSCRNGPPMQRIFRKNSRKN